MNHTRFYVPIIAFVALAAALIMQPVARVSAHHVTLTGVASCQAQSWSITWTANNSESGKVMTILSPAGFAPNPVPGSGNAVRAQSGISVATPSVTSTVSVSWPGAPPFFLPLVFDTDTATVNRPPNCPPSTATPTQTATQTRTPTWTPTATITSTPTSTTTPIITTTSTPTVTLTATPTITPTGTVSITPTATATFTPSPTSTPFQFQSSVCEGAFFVVRVNGFVQSSTFAPWCLPLPPQLPPVVVPPVVIQPPSVVVSQPVTVVQPPPVITSSRGVILPPLSGDAGLASD